MIKNNQGEGVTHGPHGVAADLAGAVTGEGPCDDGGVEPDREAEEPERNEARVDTSGRVSSSVESEQISLYCATINQNRNAATGSD